MVKSLGTLALALFYTCFVLWYAATEGHVWALCYEAVGISCLYPDSYYLDTMWLYLVWEAVWNYIDVPGLC